MNLKKISNHLIFSLLILHLSSYAQDKKQFNALLVTKTKGWHHESINEGVAAIKTLAIKNFFSVQWHQDASVRERGLRVQRRRWHRHGD